MLVFSVFMTVYFYEFFIFLACHYAVMLVWILLMRTNFCGSIDDKRRPLSEFVYNLVLAAVLIFDIVNIKEGPSRLKNAVYYTLITVENSLLMYLWWEGQVTFLDLDKPILVTAYASIQIFGFIFQLIYYRRMHPRQSLPDMDKTAYLF